MSNNKIIIAGAGASGLMCAWFLAQKGYRDITIIEKNDIPAKKLRATGNGRCNFTNKSINLSNYNGDENLIENIITCMSPSKVISEFEEIGIYHTSKEEYVYPYNQRAGAFSEVLAQSVANAGVEIKLGTRIKDIKPHEDGYILKCDDNNNYMCDILILAMGGKAAPELGGSGMAYKLCKSLGITVTDIMPGLSGFYAEGLDTKKLKGVRMRAGVGLYSDGLFVKGDVGEVQIVKDGISGIPVFQISHEAIKSIKSGKKTELTLDLMPDMGAEVLDEWLRKKVDLRGILHEKWAYVLGDELGRDADIGSLVKKIKEYKIRLTDSFGFARAQISVGGVPAEEIDKKTLESKKYKGLYIIGELLDVDGECGGYNLHMAWASAWMCANAIFLAQNS